MGARVAIGARWWGGAYKPRPPYVFPETEPVRWLPIPATPPRLEDLRELVRAFWTTLGHVAAG